ncbi:MAG: N-acetylmuramoyl-L-alanine amidase-like domain-containing protein [Verrucomicrobiota bacterium]
MKICQKQGCLSILLVTLLFPGTQQAGSPEDLPLSTRFKGTKTFHQIVKKAQDGDWASLPMGERVAKFGQELHGKPYTSFTLEIDDHIEAPSVNLDGVDCWTFFEISLGLARMVAQEKESYTPQDLLDEIEWTRYRGGVCTGDYLERIHYLAEWFFDNDARGVVDDLTDELGPTSRIQGRECKEMTVLWKSYRYLKNNPELLPKMGKLEKQVSQLPVTYIPQSRVSSVEKKLQNGDIIGIVTKHEGGFCSHVGIAFRTQDGVMRLMHATTQKPYRRVIYDKSISDYLKKFSSSIGILVGRPLDVEHTVRDREVYRKNLRATTGGKGLITLNP